MKLVFKIAKRRAVVSLKCGQKLRYTQLKKRLKLRNGNNNK